jgi:hypothetical protein
MMLERFILEAPLFIEVYTQTDNEGGEMRSGQTLERTHHRQPQAQTKFMLSGEGTVVIHRKRNSGLHSTCRCALAQLDGTAVSKAVEKRRDMHRKVIPGSGAAWPYELCHRRLIAARSPV